MTDDEQHQYVGRNLRDAEGHIEEAIIACGDVDERGMLLSVYRVLIIAQSRYHEGD